LSLPLAAIHTTIPIPNSTFNRGPAFDRARFT